MEETNQIFDKAIEFIQLESRIHRSSSVTQIVPNLIPTNPKDFLRTKRTRTIKVNTGPDPELHAYILKLQKEKKLFEKQKKLKVDPASKNRVVEKIDSKNNENQWTKPLYHIDSDEDILNTEYQNILHMGSPVSRTVFVGNLSNKVTNEIFQEIFRPFDEHVKGEIIYDPTTKESRGYGFLSFTQRAVAEKAIIYMQNFRLMDSPIKLSWSNIQENTTIPSSRQGLTRKRTRWQSLWDKQICNRESLLNNYIDNSVSTPVESASTSFSAQEKRLYLTLVHRTLETSRTHHG
ncbi:Nucleolysin TIAR [Basidiobolus ranarum]|uniref:Nucleolysin TIAR n=1 Tax=Basidiobolus ranarum TaxID=34480 RepID=A0ABR2VUZ2_9FUNG